MGSRASGWSCEPYDVSAALRLADELGVSAVMATVLVRRGHADAESARRFLSAADRHDPEAMPGVPEACRLVLEHLRRGSSIVVHGDYDVDGVCSTAILLRALRALGAHARWELPSRFDDGYGISLATVERLARAGAGLLIAVDCGITAVAEAAAARRAGLDMLVVDHHRPGATLPACPIVHPALGDYPCPDLCASGVALKLSQALRTAADRDPREAEEDLDLAALATVCDLVPLRGENRRVVREGLRALAASAKPGLRALMRACALDPGEVSEHALGFRLGPRLNAAGRMRRADAALELLTTEDGARAEEVAQELELLNRDRQEAETRILFAAEAACAAQASSAAFVVAGEGWHPGVIGIVASRLVERHHRPCVVVALDGQEGRGSGRSIPTYDLYAGLSACGEHLRRFGGHRAAAGLEIDARRLDAFRGALAHHAGARLTPGDLRPVERVDAVVPGGALALGLGEELERLRPFGAGNPQPSLLVPAARLESVAGMGAERQHARFTLRTPGSRASGVAFGSPPRTLTLCGEAPHDLAVRLEVNRWNGTVAPRVVLRAAWPTGRGTVRALGEEAPFWERLARELRADPAGPRLPPPSRPPRDRRGEGFTGVVGDLLTSGERVLVAVADLPRRRGSLEELVAGLGGALDVASWAALAARPEVCSEFQHVVALDPPPAAAPLPGDQVLHLAWSPADVEFALAVWRAELDLRPALADAWRALRSLTEPSVAALERALRGGGRYPRSPECCGRLVRVLTELGLIELDVAEPTSRVVRTERTELERSPAYRAYRERLSLIERALGSELPAAAAEAALAR